LTAADWKEKEKAHRYKVWQLAHETPRKEEQLKDEKQAVNRSKPKQVSRLTDFETLLLLYSYGQPMELALESHFSSGNGPSTPCKTTKLKSDSIDFAYKPARSEANTPPPRRMAVGSVVSLDMEEVGSLKGILTSQDEQGFQVAIRPENQKTLGTRLAHIAALKGIGAEATGTIKAGAPRIEPVRTECTFTDLTGSLKAGTIVNLSQYDALIRASAGNIPPLGSRIVFRGQEWHGAEVISIFEIGFIVKFNIPIPDEKFTRALCFSSR